MRSRALRFLVVGMGVACVTIGAVHFVWGIDSVPGEAAAGATVDSRERYYGAIFLGYGLAWIWAWCQSPIPAVSIRWLAGIFFLGGIGRLLSLAVHGQPQWFQILLTVIELLLPAVFVWLAAAEEADRSSAAGYPPDQRVLG